MKPLANFILICLVLMTLPILLLMLPMLAKYPDLLDDPKKP